MWLSCSAKNHRHLARHLERTGFVLCHGRPVRISNWRHKVWQPAADELGLPSWATPYVFRHTAASLMAQRGVPVSAAAAACDTERPKLLRLQAAADMLGISRWYLNTLIDRGDIAIVRLGDMRCVPMSEIERVLRTRFERRPREGAATRRTPGNSRLATNQPETAALRPSAARVPHALEAGDVPLDVRGIGDLLAGDQSGPPLRERTIQAALTSLADAGLVDSDQPGPGRTPPWWPCAPSGGDRKCL